MELLGGVEGVAQFGSWSLIEIKFLKAELFLAIFEADQADSSFFGLFCDHENDLEQFLTLLLLGQDLVLFLLLFTEGVIERGVRVVGFEEEFIGEDVVHHEESLVGYKSVEGLFLQKVGSLQPDVLVIFGREDVQLFSLGDHYLFIRPTLHHFFIGFQHIQGNYFTCLFVDVAINTVHCLEEDSGVLGELNLSDSTDGVVFGDLVAFENADGGDREQEQDQEGQCQLIHLVLI